MKFVKFFKGGGADYDPRQKKYAEFVCDNCGHVVDIDVTGWSDRFNISKPRSCPKCHYLNEEDHIRNLEIEIEKLTEQKNSLEVKIEALIREVSEKKNLTVQKENDILGE